MHCNTVLPPVHTALNKSLPTRFSHNKFVRISRFPVRLIPLASIFHDLITRNSTTYSSLLATNFNCLKMSVLQIPYARHAPCDIAGWPTLHVNVKNRNDGLVHASRNGSRFCGVTNSWSANKAMDLRVPRQGEGGGNFLTGIMKHKISFNLHGVVHSQGVESGESPYLLF